MGERREALISKGVLDLHDCVPVWSVAQLIGSEPFPTAINLVLPIIAR